MINPPLSNVLLNSRFAFGTSSTIVPTPDHKVLPRFVFPSLVETLPFRRIRRGVAHTGFIVGQRKYRRSVGLGKLTKEAQTRTHLGDLRGVPPTGSEYSPNGGIQLQKFGNPQITVLPARGRKLE